MAFQTVAVVPIACRNGYDRAIIAPGAVCVKPKLARLAGLESRREVVRQAGRSSTGARRT